MKAIHYCKPLQQLAAYSCMVVSCCSIPSREEKLNYNAVGLITLKENMVSDDCGNLLFGTNRVHLDARTYRQYCE
jgi:hypothetical protein